jgi:hypothetical protein
LDRKTEIDYTSLININKQNYNIGLAEYMMFLLACTLSVLMLFYMYIKAIFPYAPYLKDILIILALAFAFLSIISNGYIISKPNYLDKIIFILFIYLLFQFIYTFSRTGSFAVTYYGFRLTFLPIFIYFLIKSIKNIKYQKKIDNIIITSIVIGCFITIIESISLQLGIISPETLAKILGRNAFFLDGFPWLRVYGVVGTPHITGVYNAILFSMLFLSMEQTTLNFYSLQIRPFIKYHLKSKRKFLLILSIAAVFLSTSRTAWTIVILLLLVYPFTKPKVNYLLIFKISSLVIFVLAILIYNLRDFLEASYLGFLIVYSSKFFIDMGINQLLIDNPIIGYGFEVGDYSALLDLSTISKENLTAGTELFIGQLFRMLGAIGFGLYLFIFIIIPLRILLKKNIPQRMKIIAAPTLVIGISFGHYNPFEGLPAAMCAWYFLALLSNEISFNNKLRFGKL